MVATGQQPSSSSTDPPMTVDEVSDSVKARRINTVIDNRLRNIAEASKVVTEIYSPPRIAPWAPKVGLRKGH